MTCGIALAIAPVAAAAPGGLVLFHDNGAPDGVNAYSNVTEFVLGARRTVLDDFVVTDPSWTLNVIRHRAIWDTVEPGSGLGMEVTFRTDDGGTPGAIIAQANVTGYAEAGTGNVYFDRAEYEAWVSFTDVTLASGRYWIEAATVGPDNNFWLTAPVLNEECWVNYEDVFGLTAGSNQFGRAADLNWQIYGGLCAAPTDCCLPDGTCTLLPCADCEAMGGGPVVACAGCPEVCVGDITNSDVVDVADLIALLARWGPCEKENCPADLDRDMMVGLTDLLIVLAAWGPCP